MMRTYDYSTLCRHVDSETKLINCQIKGDVPLWLNGFVIYNGPGRTKVGDCEYKHAFDASALLQKIIIENGTVSYSTKFLQSQTFKKNNEANSITVPEFGTAAATNKGVFSRLATLMDPEKMMSDNGLLVVVKMGEHFYALGETPFFTEIDPTSLEVIKRVNLNKLFSLATQTVHIVEDEEGHYYTIGQAISMTGPKYALLKVPKNGDVSKGNIIAHIPCRWRMSPCYLHSMVLTKNYLIVIEAPLSVSIMELLSDALSNTPFIEGLHWKDETVIFHIIERRTWKPVSTRYVADSFFFLHFCNVYEEDDQIVIDLCSYKDASILRLMFIDRLMQTSQNISVNDRAAFAAMLVRYVVPVGVVNSKEGVELVKLPNTASSAKKVKNEVHLKPELLSDYSFENPVTNRSFAARGNQFAWAMGPGPEGANHSHLIKINLKSKETKTFSIDEFYVAQPIFVPSPNAQREDDGVLMTLGLQSTNENFFTMLFLDAATMTELGRATVELAVKVPLPLHA